MGQGPFPASSLIMMLCISGYQRPVLWMWAISCCWPCGIDRSQAFNSLIYIIKYIWSNLFAQKQNEPWPTSAYVVDESIFRGMKPQIGWTIFQVISKCTSSAELVTQSYKGNSLWFCKGKKSRGIGMSLELLYCFEFLCLHLVPHSTGLPETMDAAETSASWPHLHLHHTA